MAPISAAVGSIHRGLTITATAALMALGLAGCAFHKPVTDPVQDTIAAATVQRARQFNTGVSTSKGTGSLVMVSPDKRQTYRMAWAAKAPDRLRLTLTTAGFPVETIAANGSQVTFISHTGRHKPYTTASPDPNLESFIKVPVRLSEMIAVLLGRVPVRAFDRAWVAPGTNSASACVIRADKAYSSRLQELSTDSQGRVVRYRLLDRDQALVFGMDIDAYTEKKGFALPAALTVYDGAGRALKVFLPGIVPNAPVKESMFLLTGSGS